MSTENTTTPAPVVTIDQAALEKAMAMAKAPPGQQLFIALAKVQGLLQSVGKDRDVEVKSEKGRYSFKYATLAAIWDVIRKPCADNGIAIVQLPTVHLEKRVVTVETRVLHVSGEWLSCTCELPAVRTDPQGIGAVITYARRYGLSSMLGVTQDDENEEQVLADDASAGPPQSRQQPPPRATPAKAPPPPPAQPKPADGPPISVDEMEQQMRSCATKPELAKVASKLAGRFAGAERQRLLGVYREQLKVLEATP